MRTSIAKGVVNFCARRPLHDSFAWKIKIYRHCENNNNRMGRRGKLSITSFLLIMSLLLNVLQKMGDRIC
jgi:hypothetical protein